MVDDPWAAYEKKPAQTNSKDDPWASYTKQPSGNDKPKQEPSFAKDLAYGLEQGILGGSANTLKQEGYPNAAAYAAKAAKYVHDAAGLDGYDPSSGTESLGGRIANIPHSIAQSAPGMAQDIAAGAAGAAVGGPLAPLTGLLGYGASYYLRNAGNTKDRIREADGKPANAPLSETEQLRAGAGMAGDALLGRFAIGKTLRPGAVKEVGFKAAPEILKKTGQTVGIDTAVGAGQNAADSVVYDNKIPSASDTIVSGLTGGAAGLAGSSPNVLKETLRAGRFRELGKVDPQSRGEVANLIQKYNNNLDVTRKHLDQDMSLASKGLDDETKSSINEAKNLIESNQRVNPELLASIETNSPEAARAIKNLDTFGVIQGLDNGGLTGTKLVQALKPFGHWPTTGLDLGATAILLNSVNGGHIPYFGHLDPSIAATILGTQAGVYGGAKAIDRLSGASNVSKVVTDKFAAEPKAPVLPRDITAAFAAPEEPRDILSAFRARAKAKASPTQNNVNSVPTLHQLAVGDKIITRAKDDVRYAKAHDASTAARVNARNDRINELKSVVDSDEAKSLLDSLSLDWTHNDKTKAEGRARFEKLLNNPLLSEAERDALKNIQSKSDIYWTWKHD